MSRGTTFQLCAEPQPLPAPVRVGAREGKAHAGPLRPRRLNLIVSPTEFSYGADAREIIGVSSPFQARSLPNHPSVAGSAEPSGTDGPLLRIWPTEDTSKTRGLHVALRDSLCARPEHSVAVLVIPGSLRP